jgi:branched-chain amino acid transport system permease protein
MHINVILLLTLMFLCAMLGGGLVGVMVERFAYRRLRNAPRIAPLITALGVSFFLENGAQLVLGAQFQSYDSFSWSNTPIALRHFTLPAHANVSYAQIVVVVGTVLLMVALTLFVQRTQTGKAMRATAFDREAAAMMGIDVDRVIVVTFFIGSALAGAAGVFNCLAYQQVWPYMGFQAGLFAFTAAVVGGIGNLPGAVLGGLVIGLAESFATGYLSSTFQQAIVFALLIAVMLVRPSGLLGRAAVQKV